jgi:natural product biosynthesis luciferase-like monooxygenase protein
VQTSEPAEAFPLSPLQQGMLFHFVQQGRHTGVDIEQLEARLPEPIAVDVLERAWCTIAARHATLRAHFAWQGLDEPRQCILDNVAVPFRFEDLSDLEAADQKTRLEGFLQEDRRLGFDLAEAPLWRVVLFRFGPANHTLVWTYSHALLDSCYVEVLKEVFRAYESYLGGTVPLAETRPSYADHIAWLHKHIDEQVEAARAFWRARLQGVEGPTTLTTSEPSASLHSLAPGHDTLRFRMDRATSDGLHQRCSAENVRISTCVQAAWALTLAAFSGTSDVTFGTTRACRHSTTPGAESAIGLFINTVPVRVDTEGRTPVSTFLRKLRDEQMAVRPFEHTPLIDSLSSADLPRATPLFDSNIVFNEQSDEVRLRALGGNFARCSFELHDQTSFPFNVMVYADPEISFKLSYDRRRYVRSLVERIADLMHRILGALALGGSQDGLTLDDLPRLPHEDEQRLSALNATNVAVPPPACIHQSFEAQVDRTPDASAIVFRAQSLTYRALDERSNRVANALVALGVGPGARIGVFMDRGIEMVVALLGILKAGAAYVPMDPAYPAARISLMLEDTRAPVVLTRTQLAAHLPATTAHVLTIDAIDAPTVRPRVAVDPHDLAYVIFTSGSTGRPKGVEIEHRNVANFFIAMDRMLGTTPGVWLSLTSISFDISVLEIFWTLARGYNVVVQEEAVPRAARARRRIGFSLFYFAANAEEEAGQRYRLLLDGARFADAHGFDAVWTPERHFHPFGGLYPNPAVTSAAIAAVTQRIGIRAGSVVLPLHHPIRCAEDWSIVDNLSNGRVGLSFASGWHASDFALAPDNFKDRREYMARAIDTVRALWHGEAVEARSGDGTAISVRIYPKPIQRDPQIWVTASRSPETFSLAGRMGASVLTNLLVMTPEELRANIAIYRKAYREAGHAGEGHVSLMLHTFVGEHMDDVRKKVREPFLAYLRSSTDLINKAQWERTAFAKGDERNPANAPSANLDELSKEDMEALLEHAFDRYFNTVGLFGTPESCVTIVDRIRDLGVDEIACLIDFGVDTDSVLAALSNLDTLRRLSAEGADSATIDYGIAAQIRRHAVTHMQCTPSLLNLLLLESESAEAVGSLRALLIGGEALGSALLERLRPHFPAAVFNMYGPTETTVWSTSAEVRPSEPITIGRPIANTSVDIVDRTLRPVPIGVPGELMIGGAGVARGYLDHAALTTERFVSDSAAGTRRYRTGDLALWREDGTIEFLGRLDHQVKIRGYRIELGEIESVLARHSAIREALVVARDGPGGDTRLLAYVVADPTQVVRSEHWMAIWHETYRLDMTADADLDIVGWKSSYTGESIPAPLMREWADETTASILRAMPHAAARPRVLEIGCGTGLLLTRLAAACATLVGVDASSAAIERARRNLATRGHTNVSFEVLAADQLDQLRASGPFDAIVLNSVVQYFPTADYLERVLTLAYARLAPGGVLFIGDVRSLDHRMAFYLAVERAHAAPTTTVAEITARVHKRARDEAELLLAPEFFFALAGRISGAVVTGAEVKRGAGATEMNDYRYDVVIRHCADMRQAPAAPVLECPPDASAATVASLLTGQSWLHVRHVPNGRIARAVAAAHRLLVANDTTTVADLELPDRANALPRPDELCRLRPDYEVRIEWSDRPECVDLTFAHRSVSQDVPWPRLPALARLESAANVPTVGAASAPSLIAELRELCRGCLPEFMVPSAFMLLESMPLTPNGKIDRQRLPDAQEPRVPMSAAKVPTNELERVVVSVLQECVGAREIGIDDNFFDAGMNSLLMVQASIRLRNCLGRPVPLVTMFQHTTARALAAKLSTSQVDRVQKDSQDEGYARAQLRRNAMRRRQPGRPSV